MNRTRAGLLAGAARAFAADGVRGSTMQSVAAAAGVAKGTLYNYFRTKDDVVGALVAAELDRLGELAAGRTLADALVALADDLGTHPVLRRVAATEPERLVVDAGRWEVVTRRLAAALVVPDDAAELVARWLLGVVVQPGRTTVRRRQAEAVALAVAALSPVAGPG
ncbi:TetR family transcriptional regulator [Blastococcus xanthinilyticus]|uniref:TetR family transcriptional regulator n=1 Tax=Blastococcus xanthinilyticus TaxID=1564164 RepID=A0A5S5CRI8_9ACTN|nr:TetR family transcriptional regulator [Blastococcus xanthinilyticus]TYP83706.1 TetR family transcriptional regulator [Blastococcus xanthinilyticus]